MYSFINDYSEGAHPNILKKLANSNSEQQLGYGDDFYSLKAKELIRNKINNVNAQIHFVSGGTQTNLLVIASLLKTHEAVISPENGHILVNETGAIEAVGHKVITANTINGKLNTNSLQKVIKQHSLRPHVVKPKMVYISNATETGTIYSKTELIELFNFCKQNQLLLFLDGARLGHALMASNNDLTFEDIAKLTDVFYIGGTKNGALLGEAIVFNSPNLAPEFDYVLKQKGALLAKGRLLGIQFYELFKNNLYFNLAKHANQMAAKISLAIQHKGYNFLTQSTTNQIFPILPNTLIKQLKEKYLFYEWQEIDEHYTAVRLITSWATPEKKVDELIKDITQ